MARDHDGAGATAPVRTRDPPFPKPFFKYLLNLLSRRLLTSRFHGLVSDDVLLHRYTGRRSGREYSVPVGYEELDGGLYVTSLADHVWWRNVRGGAPVAVHLRGERRRGTAEVIEDDRAVAEYVDDYVARHGLDAVGHISVAVEGDSWPDTEALTSALEDLVLARIDLDETAGR